MTDLAYWHEIGLSDIDEAARRYEGILDPEHEVPLEEAEKPLLGFIAAIKDQFKDIELVVSSLGVVLRFDESRIKEITPMAQAIAEEYDLTSYAPHRRRVMGYDNSIPYRFDS